LEALAVTLGTHYIDYTLNGVDAEPRGNLSYRYAPHNTYPSLGYDAWCAIVCRDDDEWQRMVGVMGNPGWAEHESFTTVQGRLANREELDKRISEWTRSLTSRQAMLMLQHVGVPAGAVQSPEDLLRDPHLRSRGSITLVQASAPWNTLLEHPALPPRLSETPGASDGPAPTEGGDNDYVFREVMGLTNEEITRLTEEGALR
jgi:benzylsuccinate CoA-transferase BbsF subunit